MSTAAQIAANQANASLSTGPSTAEGKATSSKNNFRHGMAGRFMLTPDDDRAEFLELVDAVRAEHDPQTPTETILVERMTECFWMARKAMKYQAAAIADGDDARLAVMARYGATHERTFKSCLTELTKLKEQRAKQQIGFESQKRKEAEEARKQETHQARLRQINSRTESIEIDSEIRATIEAPLPGNERIPFEELKTAIQSAIRHLTAQNAA